MLADGASGLEGSSLGVFSQAESRSRGERLAASEELSTHAGSFDSARPALRADRAPLRMTKFFGFAIAAALVVLSACRQDMHDQPRFKPLAKSDFYSDLRSARQPVEDTVARGELREDTYFYTGKIGNTPGDFMPFPVTQKDLERGRERFNVYCSPCHSRLGDGNGMIPSRGFKHPPSYHIERLRKAPLGYFFDIATNGFGAMPEYASQIPTRDRWLIVAYIRALQLSQTATKADVPAGQQVPSQAPKFREPGSGATLPVVETNENKPEVPEHEAR